MLGREGNVIDSQDGSEASDTGSLGAREADGKKAIEVA